MPLLMAAVVSANPLGTLRNQHTFLKTSEILKIPKRFQKSLPDPNDNPNDPDCAIMCKETSDGFPFCDCQHEVPIERKIKEADTAIKGMEIFWPDNQNGKATLIHIHFSEKK